MVEEALELAPNDRDLGMWRLRLLGWSGRHEEARAALETLEREVAAPGVDEAGGAGEPGGDRELARLRGELALWRGDQEEAGAAFATYLERWPEDREIRLALAKLRLGDGDVAAARPTLEELCADGEAEACSALRGIDRSGFVLRLQAGPISSSGEGSGWRGRLGVEAPLREGLSLRAGAELQQRTYGGVTARDPSVDLGGTARVLSWLSLDVGGGLSIDPTFSPDWNAHVEAIFDLGEHFTLHARYWRIEFAAAGVDVLSPAIGYEGPFFWLSARLWRSFDPAGDGLAGLLQGGLPLVADLDLSLGIGGGDKADYLILRDVAVGAERHVVGLVGLAWTPLYELQFRVDYIGRREWRGDDSLLRHELLFGVARRW